MKRSKTNASVKSKLKKIDNRMTIFTILAIVLLIWQMVIYRKTFIDIFIPLSVFVLAGLTLFFFLRNRIAFYKNFRFGILLQSLHGMLLFGSFAVFLFMALNFYFPSKSEQNSQLKIIEADRFGGRRGRSGNPYAIVNFKGLRKQLVFNKTYVLVKGDFINLRIKKGLFGFYVIEKMEPLGIVSVNLENKN